MPGGVRTARIVDKEGVNIVGEDALEAYRLYSHRESAALLILAVWGVSNLVAGAFFSRRTSGQARHFWQVATAWGAVNALIGVPQHLDLAGPPAIPTTLAQALTDGVGTARLLSGAFISDLATMLVGGLLAWRMVARDSERLQGWGKGLIAQGLWLAVFDGILLAINGSYVRDLLNLAG